MLIPFPKAVRAPGEVPAPAMPYGMNRAEAALFAQAYEALAQCLARDMDAMDSDPRVKTVPVETLLEERGWDISIIPLVVDAAIALRRNRARSRAAVVECGNDGIGGAL